MKGLIIDQDGVQELDVNIVEVVLDALACRTAYALQQEENPIAAMKCLAVMKILREEAKEAGISIGGDGNAPMGKRTQA